MMGKPRHCSMRQDAKSKVSKGVPVTLPTPEKFYQIDGSKRQRIDHGDL